MPRDESPKSPPMPDPQDPRLAEVIETEDEIAAMTEEEFWAWMAEGPDHPGWSA